MSDICQGHLCLVYVKGICVLYRSRSSMSDICQGHLCGISQGHLCLV